VQERPVLHPEDDVERRLERRVEAERRPHDAQEADHAERAGVLLHAPHRLQEVGGRLAGKDVAELADQVRARRDLADEPEQRSARNMNGTSESSA
jgi:hypothetical protein